MRTFGAAKFCIVNFCNNLTEIAKVLEKNSDTKVK